MSDTAKMEIKPHHLRALASDIEDCHNPQSWADYCRAAAATLETQAARIAELEAALQSIVEYCDDPYLPYYKNILSKARAALEGGKS